MNRKQCGERTESLLRYCAGELEADAAAELERHIAVCDGCREAADAQHSVWDALDRWEAPAISPDFDRRLYARIGREQSWWDRWLRPLRPAIAPGLRLAAVAGLALVAAVLLDRSAAVDPPRKTASVQAEPLRPDQGQTVLEDMQLLREFDGLLPDSPESKM